MPYAIPLRVLIIVEKAEETVRFLLKGRIQSQSVGPRLIRRLLHFHLVETDRLAAEEARRLRRHLLQRLHAVQQKAIAVQNHAVRRPRAPTVSAATLDAVRFHRQIHEVASRRRSSLQPRRENLNVTSVPWSHLHHAHIHEGNAGAEKEKQTDVAEVENGVLTLIVRDNEQVRQKSDRMVR